MKSLDDHVGVPVWIPLGDYDISCKQSFAFDALYSRPLKSIFKMDIRSFKEKEIIIRVLLPLFETDFVTIFQLSLKDAFVCQFLLLLMF